MSRLYKEYLKKLENRKRTLYRKIFIECLDQGKLDNLSQKPVGIFASDLEDDKHGRRMQKWFNELAKIKLLTNMENVPISYLASKKISMLYIEEQETKKVAFDTGIYTSICDVISDDSMTLEELLRTEKQRNMYFEANKESKKEVMVDKSLEKEENITTSRDSRYNTKDMENQLRLKDIQKLVKEEIAI